MDNYHFCTYFDVNYLARGLVLHESLARHCGLPFTLWVLCMDSETFRVLCEMELPSVVPIALEDFERGDDALLTAKATRSKVEYYFTCTPSLPLYVLNQRPEVDLITYLDADLCFYGDPMPIYEEMRGRSVLAIEHRFLPELRHEEGNGVFNVGFLAFRRDDQGLGCLNWWRDRCLEWCYDRREDGRFADQKYLDEWPRLFSKLCVLEHKGAGLAPWNLANYRVSQDGDRVFVDDQPLVFYHFHGLRRTRRFVYSTNVRRYRARLSPVTRSVLYGQYIYSLARAGRMAGRYHAATGGPTASIRAEPSLPSSGRHGWLGRLLTRAMRLPIKLVNTGLRLYCGDLLVAVGTRVWSSTRSHALPRLD